MWSKREDVKPKEHKEGSRLAIVFSGSPMFTGGAGSGESDIRKWLLENDWLEAIVALPESMFYNTGIGTYVWVVTNRKEKRRKGKVQLLDARDVWTAGGSEDSKRSLGDKRRHMTSAQIDEIVRLYGRFEEGPRSKIFDNADFGYTRVTIERPLRLRYQMTTGGQGALPRRLPAPARRRAGHRQGARPRAAPGLAGDVGRDRGAPEEAQEPLEGDRAEALSLGVHAARREGRGRAQGRRRPGLRGGRRPARLRERAAQGGRRRLLRARGEAARARRVDGPSKDKVGYEINFNRYFYVFTPPGRSP
jgi:type I restriction enzyme M protein